MDHIISALSPYSSLLETLSFIATITLTVASFKALQQLKIAKNALETQSRRESRKISADYVYIYLDRIRAKEYDFKINDEQLNLLKSYRYSQDSEDGLDVKRILRVNPKLKLGTKRQRAAYLDKLDDAYDPIANILNELEAFCAAATSGVLDETTLYRAVGQSFVNLIKDLYADQLVHYLSAHQNLYTNITELYDLWSLRLEVKQLERVEEKHNETSKKIQEIKDKLGKVKNKTIQPIGVETQDPTIE